MELRRAKLYGRSDNFNKTCSIASAVICELPFNEIFPNVMINFWALFPESKELFPK